MDGKPKLQAGALGLAESITMGVAGTAPAYSIEITTSTLLATAGILAPATLLVCGLIMFGIAFAFIHLNRLSSNAGTSFAWVGAIFGRPLGFFAGWALLVLCCVFMVSAMIPAANATLLILVPDRMNDVDWVTAVAALWLTFVSAVLLKGIKVTSYVQVVLTAIEAVILLALIVLAFVEFPQAPVREFSWEWFSPFDFSAESLASSTLMAIFFYYGWDVTLNLSEETRDPNRTPGRGAFWAMIVLMTFFLVFMIVVLLGLDDETVQFYNTNILFALGERLLGPTWGYIAIIAVLLSTVGTVETQMIQFTRTLFAKGRDGALHPRYSRLHPRWNTPWVAILVIWATGMTLLFLSSYLSSINEILKDSITAIGFQISFYLGLTGFACAWYHRKTLWTAPAKSITRVLWPFASASFLFFTAVYSVPTFDLLTNVVGIGGIAVGVVPLAINRWKARQAVG